MRTVFVLSLALLALVAYAAGDASAYIPSDACDSLTTERDCTDGTGTCAWCRGLRVCVTWDACKHQPLHYTPKVCSTEAAKHMGWVLSTAIVSCGESVFLETLTFVLFASLGVLISVAGMFLCYLVLTRVLAAVVHACCSRDYRTLA